MTMTYDFLLVGPLAPERLRTTLAEVAGVGLEDVEVSPPDTDGRNWNAAVLCGYEPVFGDVSYALDIYLADRIGRPEPGEDEMARAVAVGVGAGVLYSAQPYPPSAHWLVTPDGVRTRARVFDVDPEDWPALGIGPDGAIAMTVDAVERPVTLLPRVRVAALPEVIREHRMATPVVEGLRDWLGSEALIPETGSVLWKALDRLAVWEAFTVRMNSGWPPDGWYPVEYLREDLANRDALAGAAAEVPGEVAGRFGAALERVDAAFRDGTREDPDAPADAVWWRRRVVGLGQGPQGAEEGA
ncbi:hypothetical protein [Actinoplanes sp. NBRC 103695]|uniref:hypothetical protein n=1 Tax=Actinoplanes sp. NBRC 103695 TaxID=3032202 RepID=UPI0024A11138|nr:hypothetical protein [Actinoplanes sp. NBRC 103695]GLY98420.1 hypothetical protein Acsp02_56740 [Actinoplanes sp. NBRC 103695]